MSINKRELTQENTTIDPWYKRWWVKLLYNLKITFRVGITIFICFCIGKFANDYPMLFAMMVAVLG